MKRRMHVSWEDDRRTTIKRLVTACVLAASLLLLVGPSSECRSAHSGRPL
jgi:hypothetical protein